MVGRAAAGASWLVRQNRARRCGPCEGRGVVVPMARCGWAIANTRAPPSTLAQQLTNDFRQAQHMPFPASGSLAFLFQSPALNAASGPEVLRSFVFFFGPFTLNTARGPTENHVTQAYFVFKNMSR